MMQHDSAMLQQQLVLPLQKTHAVLQLETSLACIQCCPALTWCAS